MRFFCYFEADFDDFQSILGCRCGCLFEGRKKFELIMRLKLPLSGFSRVNEPKVVS